MIIYLEVEIDDRTGKVLSSKPFTPTNTTNTPVEAKEFDSNPDIILSDNKLELSNKFMSLLNLTVGDKIDIYYLEIDGIIKPVVAKSGLFGSSGNKITKSLTISFRQSKHAQLSIYGSCFTVELDKTAKFGVLIPLDGVPKLFKKDLEDVQILEDIPLEEPLKEIETPKVSLFGSLGKFN